MESGSILPLFHIRGVEMASYFGTWSHYNADLDILLQHLMFLTK